MEFKREGNYRRFQAFRNSHFMRLSSASSYLGFKRTTLRSFLVTESGDIRGKSGKSIVCVHREELTRHFRKSYRYITTSNALGVSLFDSKYQDWFTFSLGGSNQKVVLLALLYSVSIALYLKGFCPYTFNSLFASKAIKPHLSNRYMSFFDKKILDLILEAANEASFGSWGDFDFSEDTSKWGSFR